MADQQPSPSIWITHAWADDHDGNFDYIISRLEAVGVEARYDRRDLVVGDPLWPQIEARITNDPIDGWGIILTRNSLTNRRCREELNYALDRALYARGEGFKIIAILDGDVPIADAPVALRTRLGVNLEAAEWPRLVKQGLLGEAPGGMAEPVSEYIWTVHYEYRRFTAADPRPAVEVRPRFGQISAWQFLVPPGTVIERHGVGDARGLPFAQVQRNIWEPDESCGGQIMTGPMAGVEFRWFGAADPISASRSAYVIFPQSFPDFVGFLPVPASGLNGDSIERVEVISPRDGRMLLRIARS